MKETEPERPTSLPVPDAVAAYKTILKTVLDLRPSGMRRRLAKRLGRNPSFVSQISNPSYPTPIPAAHVEAIIEVCHFSPEERQRFLAAYEAAHPERMGMVHSSGAGRNLTLTVPDLGSSERNAEFDRAVIHFIQKMARLLQPDK